MHKRSTSLGKVANLSLLAPIKPGLVNCFDPVTYQERLRKVLDATQSSRKNKTESELGMPAFPDLVGQFGIIQHFRYAIVPPRDRCGTWQLSLNVSFDGGWEPYLRVIYRDLGALLDLLFCHCEGYPLSSVVTFNAYSDWVRSSEIEGGTFYTDSSMSIGDQRYLQAIESIGRIETDSEKRIADFDLSQTVNPPVSPKTIDEMKEAMAVPFRALKGLYRLSVYFPELDSADGGNPSDEKILQAFAQEALRKPLQLLMAFRKKISAPSADSGQHLAQLLALFQDELAWVTEDLKQREKKRESREFDEQLLQHQVLGKNEDAVVGCVVLLRVADPKKAGVETKRMAGACQGVGSDGISRFVALTYPGLTKLHIRSSILDALPQEFVDGMERRCGLLGDVRGNHPDYWSLPKPYGDPGATGSVDMKVVDMMIQMRVSDEKSGHHELMERLQEAVEKIQRDDNGLRVLAVQEMKKSGDQAAGSKSKGLSRGHFGFVDGISQPEFVSEQEKAEDEEHPHKTRAGELLLGHGNERGDAADFDIDPFLVNGSFMVVRKLRQRLAHLDEALSKPEVTAGKEAVLAKMMGRQVDGTPLVSSPKASPGDNDFSFTPAEAGRRCPRNAHIRLANPRDGRSYTPRILRRGMPYDERLARNADPREPVKDKTEPDRGIVFMAFCSSIAEQFEVIQGWMSGGNSTGLNSAQNDPFLALPKIEEDRVFRYVDDSGVVQRVSLGQKPFVELQWGLYLFVPSIQVIQDLPKYQVLGGQSGARRHTGAVRHQAAQAFRQPESEKAFQEMLEDEEQAEHLWSWARENPEQAKAMPYGSLVGSYQEVLSSLKDSGGRFSVSGYKQRMRASIGDNLLAYDKEESLREQEIDVNEVIKEVSEADAFEVTQKIVAQLVSIFPEVPAPAALPAPTSTRSAVDLVSVSDFVLASLCNYWLGLPDLPGTVNPAFLSSGGRVEPAPTVPRCPGNVSSASRYIFSPHPNEAIQSSGKVQGSAALAGVEDWLQAHRKKGTEPGGSMVASIKSRYPSMTDDRLAVCVTGVMLGFTPTVHGNFLRTMDTWIEDERLWLYQQMLLEAVNTQGHLSFEVASEVLRKPLLGAMRQRPVPENLWRSPVQKGKPNESPDSRVILGLKSALTDQDAPDELMFGADRPRARPTVHGCPGYSMAMGVMLGMISGLLTAGTLRPTGSPVLLVLSR